MEQSRLNKIVIVLIYLTIFFNSLIFFKQPFEFHVGYLVYLLLMPGFFIRYKISFPFVAVFSILFIVGAVNCYFGLNTVGDFVKVFLGVFMSYVFYYFVLCEFKFDIKKLFNYYLYGCYLVGVLGIIQLISFKIGFGPGYNYRWIFNSWGVVYGGNLGIRLNTVCGEPSQLAELMSAALFVAVYDLINTKKYYYTNRQALFVVATFVLTFSSSGYIAFFLVLALLLVNYGLVKYIAFAVPVAIGLFYLIYNNVPAFQERWDSQIRVYSTGVFNIAKDHGSTIIQYNNYHVATENFKENPFFGTGLGSHPVAFEKYSITKHIETPGFNLNTKDANSMLYRTISEMGLFGLLMIAFYLVRFYTYRAKTDDEDYDNAFWLISNAVLIMIAVKLVRQGHYFLNGFPFFVLLYYYSWKQNKEMLRSIKNKLKIDSMMRLGAEREGKSLNEVMHGKT